MRPDNYPETNFWEVLDFLQQPLTPTLKQKVFAVLKKYPSQDNLGCRNLYYVKWETLQWKDKQKIINILKDKAIAKIKSLIQDFKKKHKYENLKRSQEICTWLITGELPIKEPVAYTDMGYPLY